MQIAITHKGADGDAYTDTFTDASLDTEFQPGMVAVRGKLKGSALYNEPRTVYYPAANVIRVTETGEPNFNVELKTEDYYVVYKVTWQPETADDHAPMDTDHIFKCTDERAVANEIVEIGKLEQILPYLQKIVKDEVPSRHG